MQSFPVGDLSVRQQGRTRILGIDPGTIRLGYGVIDHHSAADLRYVECGVIAAPARETRTERLLLIGRGLRDLVAEIRPDVVAIEEAFFGENVKSTIALGEARGVALFIAADVGLVVANYPPAAVKLSVVGHGRATKEQVGFLVRACLRLRRAPETDAADALAIAICHARMAAGSRALAQGRPR